MGFLGPAPADKLAASYDPRSQVLTLCAEGSAQNFTYGYKFHRVSPWFGGLKFDFTAWSGPHAAGSRSFDYCQSFDIANLKAIIPSGKIIINTAEGDKEVPIRWLGLDPGKGDQDTLGSSAPADPDDNASKVLDAGSVNITALYKEPFTLKETVPLTQNATVDMKYQNSALSLEDAGMNLGALFWTFNSLETGTTQVVVTIRPNVVDGLIIQKVYNIKVIVLDNVLTAIGDKLSLTNEGEILSFRGCVFIAQRIVQRTWPDAKLLEVSATKNTPFPVTDPLFLSQLECIFTTGDGTVRIKPIGWGEFGKPIYISERWVGSVSFDIRDTRLDITDAADAMQKAGIKLSFFSAELDHPLVSPGSLRDEPYYFFKMVDASVVLVGAIDGDIIVNATGQKLPVDKANAAS